MNLALKVGQLRHGLYWEALLSILAVYTAVAAPLHAVYGIEDSAVFLSARIAISTLFFADLVFNILVPQKGTGADNKSKDELRRKYFRGWFIWDFLAVVPLDLLVHLVPGVSPVVRALRILNMARILRLPQFFKRREIRQRTDQGAVRLLIFLFWFLLAANFVTCGWLYLGAGNIDAQLDHTAKYIRSFYWCITTLATVGYGDITPVTIPQTLYATFVMILGVAIYGYVISSVTALLSNIDVARNQYIKTMDKVNAFSSYNELPEKLHQRIRNYHEYLFESRLGYSEGDVLSELPDSIKSDVAMYLHRDLLTKVPLFRNASENVMREIVLELEAQVVPPNDYVFRAGDEGEEMYFIRKGSVDVLSPDGTKVFATLSDGAFFGEVALLFRQPRNASIRAKEYADLYVLKSSAVEKVMKRYPEFAAHLQAQAEARKGS